MSKKIERARIIGQEIEACGCFLRRLEAQRRGPGSIRNQVTFDQVVLTRKIYQTRVLLDWLHELQAEFAQTR